MKDSKLPKINYAVISKDQDKLFVNSKIDVIEFYYPLKERIKLYKSNKRIDDFIFFFKSKDLINSCCENKQIEKEARELFKEIMGEKC